MGELGAGQGPCASACIGAAAHPLQPWCPAVLKQHGAQSGTALAAVRAWLSPCKAQSTPGQARQGQGGCGCPLQKALANPVPDWVGCCPEHCWALGLDVHQGQEETLQQAVHSPSPNRASEDSEAKAGGFSEQLMCFHHYSICSWLYAAPGAPGTEIQERQRPAWLTSPVRTPVLQAVLSGSSDGCRSWGTALGWCWQECVSCRNSGHSAGLGTGNPSLVSLAKVPLLGPCSWADFHGGLLSPVPGSSSLCCFYVYHRKTQTSTPAQPAPPCLYMTAEGLFTAQVTLLLFFSLKSGPFI